MDGLILRENRSIYGAFLKIGKPFLHLEIDGQFQSLPAQKRLNGFYLQELMHYYAEKLGESILDND